MKNILLSFAFFLSANYTLASTGGFEDGLANVISWIVITIFPLIGIYLFWKAHIYPEIVAERNNHPQLEAIKTMCLLSLFVGGLLWPIALIWANYKYPEKQTTTQPDQGEEVGNEIVPKEIQTKEVSENSDDQESEINNA